MCSFDGVPTPSVVWTQNGTMVLDNSVPGVTVTVNNVIGDTTLTIASLGRDGGGLYRCIFNISDAVFVVNATTVLVLGEC